MAIKTCTGVTGQPYVHVVARLSQSATVTGSGLDAPILTNVNGAADGTYSISLWAANDLTPTGTYYTITEFLGTTDNAFNVQVPATAGPFAVTSILVGTPTASPTPNHVSTLTVDTGPLVLPAASIADSALSANVDLLNAAQTLTGVKRVTNQASSWEGQVFDDGGMVVNASNPRYGAVGDGRLVNDGAMGAGSSVLTSATAAFTAADVGKRLVVDPTGLLGAALVGTISGYTNATTITASFTNSGGAISSAVVSVFTDNAAAFQAAITRANVLAAQTPHSMVRVVAAPGRYGFRYTGNSVTPPTFHALFYALLMAPNVLLDLTGVTVMMPFDGTITSQTLIAVPNGASHFAIKSDNGTFDGCARSTGAQNYEAEHVAITLSAATDFVISDMEFLGWHGKSIFQVDGSGTGIRRFKYERLYFHDSISNAIGIAGGGGTTFGGATDFEIVDCRAYNNLNVVGGGGAEAFILGTVVRGLIADCELWNWGQLSFVPTGPSSRLRIARMDISLPSTALGGGTACINFGPVAYSDIIVEASILDTTAVIASIGGCVYFGGSGSSFNRLLFVGITLLIQNVSNANGMKIAPSDASTDLTLNATNGAVIGGVKGGMDVSGPITNLSITGAVLDQGLFNIGSGVSGAIVLVGVAVNTASFAVGTLTIACSNAMLSACSFIFNNSNANVALTGNNISLSSVIVSNPAAGAGVGILAVSGSNCSMLGGSIVSKAGAYYVKESGGANNNSYIGVSVSGGATFNGLGAASQIRNCPGWNPQGVAAITVTASPFTYTNADNVPEAIYIDAGTVSAIAKNAITVFTSTGKTIWLEPNEATTVTYSVAPTMNKDRK